ncbi:5-formyltetrahydrofolate cyclo-ligase [Streptococcus chenjunshii]|uniref:5-formyltetrahydrofolate cyclo-ligase n=1 Tax=Streptococcus chenjunshii TaxID=2173853 RepID=A0A372KQ57_9STRE|nr:5-formyltetrahydrofolate cyclo-ligase [Streptococcus chenjunshii]AXQ77847.1 5-formyltetrahydrofolate cyclo-ligase [Streptococcus chenjunshii]RFU51358.1 5-formyltetrahydrofolate cyclo-ligase [Streptococcus chenjunshii]RFU53768.1 5-formyltetrahydrofolate cyclo-ligase [Streptococcus chenjunshii]
MDKEAIRQNLIKRLKSHNPADKEKLDKLLLDDITASEAYHTSQVLATYLAFSFEYDTQPLIERAVRDGKKVLVPRTCSQGKMVFASYHPEHLIKGRFGILEPDSSRETAEPSEIDLIHVPGLAFNAEGFRIGYGGGYYDRYLADFKGRTVSTVYAWQRLDFKEDAHDVAVMEVFSQ